METRVGTIGHVKEKRNIPWVVRFTAVPRSGRGLNLHPPRTTSPWGDGMVSLGGDDIITGGGVKIHGTPANSPYLDHLNIVCANSTCKGIVTL
jgi:hypothetical protein